MEAGVGVGRFLVCYGSPQMQRSGFWTKNKSLQICCSGKSRLAFLAFFAFWLFSRFRDWFSWIVIWPWTDMLCFRRKWELLEILFSCESAAKLWLLKVVNKPECLLPCFISVLLSWQQTPSRYLGDPAGALTDKNWMDLNWSHSVHPPAVLLHGYNSSVHLRDYW